MRAKLSDLAILLTLRVFHGPEESVHVNQRGFFQDDQKEVSGGSCTHSSGATTQRAKLSHFREQSPAKFTNSSYHVLTVKDIGLASSSIRTTRVIRHLFLEILWPIIS